MWACVCVCLSVPVCVCLCLCVCFPFQEGVKTENDHINLKVAGQDGSVVQFKIKRHTPLSKLMKAYCERQVGLSVLQVHLTSVNKLCVNVAAFFWCVFCRVWQFVRYGLGSMDSPSTKRTHLHRWVTWGQATHLILCHVMLLNVLLLLHHSLIAIYSIRKFIHHANDACDVDHIVST